MLFKRPSISQQDTKTYIDRLVDLTVGTEFLLRKIHTSPNGTLVVVDPNHLGIVGYGITKEGKFRVAVGKIHRSLNGFLDNCCCATITANGKVTTYDMDLSRIDYVMGYLSK